VRQGSREVGIDGIHEGVLCVVEDGIGVGKGLVGGVGEEEVEVEEVAGVGGTILVTDAHEEFVGLR